MSIKDKDGLYPNWVPIGLVIVAILYSLFLIFYAFPWIDKNLK